MEPPDVLRRENVNQATALHMPYLDEARLKGQNVRVEYGECLRVTFPCDSPVGASAPAVAIDVEGVICVAKQELASDALDVNRFDVLLAHDKVQRGVGLVEQRLGLQRLEADDFETSRAPNAQFGPQEMDRGGRGRDVELFLWFELL